MQESITAFTYSEHTSQPGLEQVSREILTLLQEESLIRFPAFPEIFGLLTPRIHTGLKSPLETDGKFLYYHPILLCSSYLDSTESLRHMYLHVHLHCLCHHMILGYDKETALWKEACDLSVTMLEALLISDAYPQSRLSPLLPEGWLDAGSILSLLQTYPELRETAFSCSCDTHEFWFHKEKESDNTFPENSSCQKGSGPILTSSGLHHPDALKAQWNHAHKKLSVFLKENGEKMGTASGTGTEQAAIQKQDSIDYRQFLKRFAIPREEAILDMDSFDYIPYYYGLTHYGNMPFCEPLEYREVNRLDELAIAIDTSGSCSGGIVRRFLTETWNILSQRENFFSRMRLHFIQCDSMIQEHRIFTDVREWEDAIPNIRILGQGNTDFRPVFTLLDNLIRQKEIRRLRGLLYFTDGDGIFPTERPVYDTAFIFLNQATEKHKLPDWAIRLNLDLPDDFT